VHYIVPEIFSPWQPYRNMFVLSFKKVVSKHSPFYLVNLNYEKDQFCQ